MAGTDPFPAAHVRYYNGFTQAQVKPSPDAPLLKLGVDKAVPVMTSAVMLDAMAYRGRRLDAGELVTAADIEGMLSLQGLQHRGILPGDAVFVHTGWGACGAIPRTTRRSPSTTRGAPASRWMRKRTWRSARGDGGADTPVTTRTDAAAASHAAGLPFSVHQHNLTRTASTDQNLVLDEMARDRVSLSCAIVLPRRILGGAGSMVRPIAVVPSR